MEIFLPEFLDSILASRLLVWFVGIVVLVLGSLFYAGGSLAIWVPTQSADLERVNRLSALQDGEVFMELGCGDGRLCHYIAKHNPHAKVIGIEMAWPMYVWSWIRCWLWPMENLSIVYGDALKINCSPADVVYFFVLSKTINAKLKPKLKRELSRGAKILSYDIAFDYWDGGCQKDHPKGCRTPIYEYEV